MDMTDVLESTHPTRRFDKVISWLTARDKEKVSAATASLRRLGRAATPRLVYEACTPGKQSKYCLVILDQVQQIGGPVGPDEMHGLESLLMHDDHNVIAKAEEVIMAVTMSGVPDRVENAALVRTPSHCPPRCPPPSRRFSDFQAALRGDLDALRRRARSSAALRRRKEG